MRVVCLSFLSNLDEWRCKISRAVIGEENGLWKIWDVAANTAVNTSGDSDKVGNCDVSKSLGCCVGAWMPDWIAHVSVPAQHRTVALQSQIELLSPTL
jgi:hypothetical protein